MTPEATEEPRRLTDPFALDSDEQVGHVTPGGDPATAFATGTGYRDLYAPATFDALDEGDEPPNPTTRSTTPRSPVVTGPGGSSGSDPYPRRGYGIYCSDLRKQSQQWPSKHARTGAPQRRTASCSREAGRQDVSTSGMKAAGSSTPMFVGRWIGCSEDWLHVRSRGTFF